MHSKMDYNLNLYEHTITTLSNCLIYDTLNKERCETSESETAFYALELDIYRKQPNMTDTEIRNYIQSTTVHDGYIEKNEFLISLFNKLEDKVPGKYKQAELRFLNSYQILEFPDGLTEEYISIIENILYKSHLRFKNTYFEHYFLSNV